MFHLKIILTVFKFFTTSASNDQVFHGEPKRIEDTFALAMTFMSEPKEASTGKIKKYIERYYNRDLNIDK